jgi:hypothetical protein
VLCRKCHNECPDVPYGLCFRCAVEAGVIDTDKIPANDLMKMLWEGDRICFLVIFGVLLTILLVCSLIIGIKECISWFPLLEAGWRFIWERMMLYVSI